MLQFRHGNELYSYCASCTYSATTPTSGLLGCTKGDDPEVMAHSEKVDEGETDPEVERCPGFEHEDMSTNTETQTVLSMLIESDKRARQFEAAKEAGFYKEVPDDNPNPDEVIDWEEVLEEGIGQLRQNPASSEADDLVQQALDEMKRQEHSSWQEPEQEYDYDDSDREGERANYPDYGDDIQPPRAVESLLKQVSVED
jgi:hypothetical protein